MTKQTYEGALNLEGKVLSIDFVQGGFEFHVPLETDDILEIKSAKNEVLLKGIYKKLEDNVEGVCLVANPQALIDLHDEEIMDFFKEDAYTATVSREKENTIIPLVLAINSFAANNISSHMREAERKAVSKFENA